METTADRTRRKIGEWVKREFQPNQVDKVAQDLLDVAIGNRHGNKFERDALARVLGDDWNPPSDMEAKRQKQLKDPGRAAVQMGHARRGSS